MGKKVKAPKKVALEMNRTAFPSREKKSNERKGREAFNRKTFARRKERERERKREREREPGNLARIETHG